MLSRVFLINIILKLIQGIFACIIIGFQSHSLSRLDFNNLSIIGNAIIFSTFLDLGVGVNFVQSYFLKYKNMNYIDEDRFAFNFLKMHISLFIITSIFQAAVVTLYTLFAIPGGKDNLNISLITITFFVTFFYSLTSFLSRILTAKGMVFELLLFQLLGILVQLITTFLLFNCSAQLTYFLVSLAVPNLLVGLLSFKILASRVTSDENLKNILSKNFKMNKNNFSFSSNLMIQILQIAQFATLTIPIAIFAHISEQTTMFTVLITLRIFSSVASSLSSFNTIEWRQRSLKGLSSALDVKNDNIYLLQKIFIGILLSIATASITSVFWNVLSRNTKMPSELMWITWILYIIVQIVQWHYYYKILAQSKYVNLLIGTLIQFCAMSLVIILLDPDWSETFPLSSVCGITLSSIYLLLVSLRNSTESKD